MNVTRLVLLLLPAAVLLAGCPGDRLPGYFSGKWTVCHENESTDHFPSDAVFSFHRTWSREERYEVKLHNKEGWSESDAENLEKARFRVMPEAGDFEAAKVLLWPDGCGGEVSGAKATAVAKSTGVSPKSVGRTHSSPHDDPVLKPNAKTIRLEATVCMYDPMFQDLEECGGDLALHVVKFYIAPSTADYPEPLAIVHYCSPAENEDGACTHKSGEIPHPGHVHGDD